jgi:hypothetical protein
MPVQMCDVHFESGECVLQGDRHIRVQVHATPFESRVFCNAQTEFEIAGFALNMWLAFPGEGLFLILLHADLHLDLQVHDNLASKMPASAPRESSSPG